MFKEKSNRKLRHGDNANDGKDSTNSKRFKLQYITRQVFGRLHCKDKEQMENDIITKTEQIGRIVELASALRNSGGGHIIIYVNGQRQDDKNLEFFDEAFTPKLKALLDIESQYCEVFSRLWKKDASPPCIDLTVRSAKYTCTSDFCTKIRYDNKNQNATLNDILRSLSKPCSNVAQKPRIRGLMDNLTENRHIEMKALPNDKERDIRDNPSHLVDYIWNDLKLKHNLISFSTVNEGGSYYLGIREKEVEKGCYKTKESIFKGFLFNGSQETFSKNLAAKISSEISALGADYIFSPAPPSDLIQISFHAIENRYILEVSVREFHGVLFFDKGPKAYTLVDNKICKMSKEEWLEGIKSVTIPDWFL